MVGTKLGTILRHALFAGTLIKKAKPPSSSPRAQRLAQAQDLTSRVPGFYITGLCRVRRTCLRISLRRKVVSIIADYVN